MEHAEIRRKLSAYLDNAVSAEEKEEIKRHLRSCGSCGEEIADLELVLGYLKTLPSVESPPWLTAKIMAQVGEISGHRSAFWRRLFFPLHVKLPLEALALLFICVTGYYLARTVGTETPLTTPAPPPMQAVVPPSPHPAMPAQSQRAPAQHSIAPPAKTAAPRPAAPSPPAVEQPAAAKSAAPAPAPVPAPARRAEPMVVPELRTTDEGPSFEGEAPPFPVGEEKGLHRGVAKKAKKATRNGAASVDDKGETVGNRGEITLAVDDPAAAAKVIEQTVTRLGGRINGHSYGEEDHLLIIRIGTQKIPDLIDRLGHLGTVLDKPQIYRGTGGTTDLSIRW